MTGEPVTVRTAQADDVDAVREVGHRTWPPTYTPIAGADYVRTGLEQWWSRERTAQSIAAGRVLVAERAGAVVGMAAYTVEGDALDLWRLYVVPEAHGTGAGHALLEAVTAGPAAGLRVVRLAHMDGNTAARAFYERQGFTETHRSADEIGGPDNVWMERPVDRSGGH
ncbi:GNAT family N-acetyltransferase [Pimelobacter simplex]|uniref:GNAT family N-acetyltransferase n=1 Tax=Nocardioides simplex TaxID=2045 RepID=UPI003AAB8CFF